MSGNIIVVIRIDTGIDNSPEWVSKTEEDNNNETGLGLLMTVG